MPWEYRVMGKRLRHRWLERVIEEAERMSRLPGRQARLPQREERGAPARKGRPAAERTRLSA